jgi:hypothetical protein
MLVEPNYDSLTFKSPDDRFYFDYCLHLSWKAGLFNSGHAMQSLIQIARAYPAMCRTATAIGALTMALPPSAQHLSAGKPPEPKHYEHAIVTYNEGMQNVRRAGPAATSDSLFQTVLASLFFCLFEYFHGNRKMSVAHGEHWQKIMGQYFRQRCIDTNLPFEELPTSDIEIEVISAFQRMTTKPWAYSLLASSRFDGDTQANWCCRGLKHKYMADDMPERFGSQPEARRWWDCCQHFIKHQSSIISLQRAQSETAQGPQAINTAENEIEACGEFGGSVSLDRCINVCHRWNLAFLPFYREAARNKQQDPTTYVQAVTLHLMYSLLQDEILRAFGHDVSVLPNRVHLFREIVTASRENLGKFKVNASITEIDHALIWPLTIVLHRCPDREIWGEAVVLLSGSDLQSNESCRQRGEDIGDEKEEFPPPLDRAPGMWIDRSHFGSMKPRA